jgi:hypothetical protein
VDHVSLDRVPWTAIPARYPSREPVFKKETTSIPFEQRTRSPLRRAYLLPSTQIATNNFSAGNLLGQGGFGRVYKGTLDDGTAIAVKKLAESNQHGPQEFKVRLLVKTHLVCSGLLFLSILFSVAYIAAETEPHNRPV